MKKPSARRDARVPAPAPSAPPALASVTGGVSPDVEPVDRSGFLDSGPSDTNRRRERHELPGNTGG